MAKPELFTQSYMLQISIYVKGLQKYSFGLLPIIAFLGIALLSVACTKKRSTVTTSTTMTVPVTTGTKKLLALGDSYTIGESVSEADRFPNQTIRLLQGKGFDFSYPSTIVARTGWTTQNLLDGIATSDIAKNAPYDAITLLIGVNNQYQGRDTGEYRIQFTECLNKSIQFAGSKKEHVFVVSIPDWGVTPFGASANPTQVAAAIDRFNAINKQITTSMGVAYIDITPISRQSDASMVAGDGLHPSGKQYGQWSNLLAPVMEQQLK